MNTTHPYSPISTARAAGVEARRMRAEHLLAVSERLLSPLDVVELAAQYEHRALRRIRLHVLLSAQPGVGEVKARLVCENMLRTLHGRELTDTERKSVKRLTVAWLLDTRSAGRRWVAFYDALHRKRVPSPPWPGFPFAPEVKGVEAP